MLISWNIQPDEKIAYCRGSFDPPHLSHLEEVIQKALAEGVSQVFIEPIEGNLFFPYSVRMEMLKAFENDQIHIITKFDNTLNNGNLYFLCGSDLICSNYSLIKSNMFKFAGYLVNPRRDYPLSNELIESLYPTKIILLKDDQTHITSTKVREHINKHLPLTGLVHKTTEDLINLYQIYEKISEAKRKKQLTNLPLNRFISDAPIAAALQRLTHSDEISTVIKKSPKSLKKSFPYVDYQGLRSTNLTQSEISQIQIEEDIYIFRTEKFIIKCYSTRRYQEFIDEIWAIETLRRYEPKTFLVPSIVSVFSLEKLLDTYYVIVEKIAPGVPIDDASSNHAIYRFGEALAELHGLKKSTNNLKFFRQIKSYKLPYSLEQKLTKSPYTNYIQFDMHGKNALYDSETDQITLIDLSAIGFFTDKNSNPTAPSTIDYVAACALLSKCNPKAIEYFEKGYRSQGGRHFTNAELKTYWEYHKKVLQEIVN